MYLAHNSRSWKDKEGLVLAAHAYNPSAEAKLKCKAPGLYSKKQRFTKKERKQTTLPHLVRPLLP